MPSLRLIAAALAIPALVGGCASDTNYVRDVAQLAGVTGGEPKAAPDFISRTRSANVDFVPVGTSAPKRTKQKTAAEIGIAEKELDALKSQTDAKGAEARRAAAQ